MAIGEVSVHVVPDARDWWNTFRQQTSGRATSEGRRVGDDLMRGIESRTARGATVKVSADTTRARSDVAALETELRRLNIARLQPKFDGKQARTQIAEMKAQLAGLSTRPDINTSRAQAQLAALSAQVRETKEQEKQLDQQGSQSGAGLLMALLPLAPALAPLAGAATAAGAAIGASMASSILAVLGLKNAMTGIGPVAARTASSVSAVKDALSGLEASAAHAALPGLEASVAAITSQMPKLTQIVSGQAAVAGQVVAHLTRGVIGEFENLGPVITSVSRDIDALAAHFESWATGPGGAHFAQTLATDYQKVRPEIISLEHAFADLLAAGSSSGLGIISLIGDLARVVSSFPTPVLTAIVDGFLAFRAVSVASTAASAVQRAFTGIQGAAQRAAASTQLAATQRAAAETAAAAATAEAEATSAEAMLATAAAAREELLAVATTRGQLSGDQTAAMQVQIAIADREIASYEAVAIAARESAAQQAAAAEEAAAARTATAEAAGAASLGAAAASLLGPVGLAVGGLLLLTTAFGSSGDSASAAASEIDGYTNALINSNGVIDQSVRTRAAANLQTAGLIDSAKQFGISQGQLTDAVLNGGSALTSVNAILDAHTTKASKAAGNILELSGSYKTTRQSASILKDSIAGEAALFQQGASAAGDQRAAIDNVSEATREHARALHSTVGAYVAAEAAAAGNVEKTREQTVAFQLAGDAASLFNQALESLAGQNLNVAQAQTAYRQSLHSITDALKQNGLAIRGNSTGALANQQAVEGSVASARQLADAVSKQTHSTSAATRSYRDSRDALLAQLRAHHQLTPALRKYVNDLFDVKGVSDYLSKHPTKLDANATAAHAKVKSLRDAIKAIRQGKVPYLDANSAAGRAKIRQLQRAIDTILQRHPPKLDADASAGHAKARALQAEIDAIHQRQEVGVGVNAIAAENEISRIQGMIDALHGKTVTITTISANGGSVSVGSGGRGYNASAAGSASWTPDGKLPPGLSTVGERGWELVSTDSRGRSRVFSHAQSVAMTGMPRTLPGFAAGTSAAQVQSTNALVPDAHSIFGALSGSVGGMRQAVAAFIKDFKAAGATTRQVARAAADDAKLVANQQKLVAARSKLANVTQYSDSIRSTLTGSFDPTHFGSVADLIGGYQGQTDQNNAYAKEVAALRKRAGKDGSALGLINTLTASGQTASLESLYSGSARDLTNAGKAYSGYNSSVQGGVDAASTAKYGETQGQASKDVQALKDVSVTLLNGVARLGAAVARSHGSSGARVEREMEKFAHEMETLVRHGRH